MTSNFIHSSSPASQNHPPRGVTFSGDPSVYTPSESGILIIREDSFPKKLYMTTGINAGDLEEIGSLVETFTGSPFAYQPKGADALLLKTDGNQPSLWKSTGTNPGNTTHITGAILGYNGSPFGNLTGDFVFQLCVDRQNQLLYYCNQYGSTNWTALDGLGGGGST